MNEIISFLGANIFRDNELVLENLTLKINHGDFLYLVGETGSGKSSFLKSLYAEIKINTGSAKLDRFNLREILKSDIPFLRRQIGIVFQDFKLLSDRNIEENLRFVLKATGWKDNVKINQRINEVLKSVHLEDFNQKEPHELSGGEKQRASIARALLNHPKIILADEPTGNLDPEKSINIINLLKDINQTGTTIINATHDYSIIKQFPSTIYECKDKKVNKVDIKKFIS